MAHREIIDIKRLAFGGDAVGNLSNGKIVLVPGALPGETVEIALWQDKKNFARGKLLQILTPSPDRRKPACPYFSSGCPGCAYLHTSYEQELFWKQQQLKFFLRRQLTTANLAEPVAAPQRLNWRNKLVLHCRNGQCGYLGTDNVSLVPLRQCRLGRPELNELLKSAAIPESGKIELRYTEANGALQYDFAGPPALRLTEFLPGIGSFDVPAGGFFQTNIAVATQLVAETTAEMAQHDISRLLELYCGVGVFSIAGAERIPELVAVGCEQNAAAVAAAKDNAVKHGVADRCRFVAADAAAFLATLMREETPQALLVDPPRAGLSPQAIAGILKLKPQLIFYISCGPDTLARDLNRLEADYHLESARLFDMFPGTAHFETLTILRNKTR